MPRLIFTGPDALLRIHVYEQAELAEPAVVRESELTSEHTEPMLRALIKCRFTCYMEDRADCKYDGPLLFNLKRDVALYCLLVPWFWSKTIFSISDLQAFVDHLPEDLNTSWRTETSHQP